MLINVLDSQLRKVAMLSNDVPGLPNYYNDEFHDYLDQGATTHKFTVSKIINNKLQDYVQFLSHQSYFSFRKNGQDYLMSPASSQAVHETSSEISFVCVSLDRELMNEMSNPLANTASHNIQWYFDTMGLISRTQITIGINEVASFTRTISYDGQETKLSRLISVINNFNAEFEFITKLNNDGTLDSVTLNIYKENDGQNVQGVGTKRDDVRLSFGKNIEDVTVDVSDDGFFNACYLTGADGYSWKNYDFSYKNADGVEEFYKRKGSEIAYAPLSAQMFPSQLKTDKGDIWTSIDETTEYKNANDMWGYIVKKFKQYAYHQITYTVTPSATLLGQLIGDGRPLQKGDTVIIQDNNYIDINGTVGLILSARVSEIIESESNPENNQIVFSNYKKLKSQASADIQSIVSQLVDEATPYRSLIETTNGTQFKNGTGSTVLTARIYKGSSDAETVADSYAWTKDGASIATTQAITVNATDIADKSVYTFQATVGGKTVGTWSVTITNVNDGKQGLKGDPGTPGTPGTNGTSITITSKQILYQNSTSGTTAPTGTWSTTIPSTPQGQFRWARTIVNYSDGTSTKTDLVGYVGVDGQVGPQGKPTGITQQETEPTNKYAGMMWQYTGTSNITIGNTTIAPQVQYIYDGAQWRMYILNVANISAQTLAAITANLGTVTAGMIKAYIDYTYYNNSATGIPAKAYLRIDANNVNQKLALQSPSGVDWGYIRQDTNGITIFADTKNAGTIGNASGRYVSTNYGGAGISFINSNNASINANGDLDVSTPYTGTGSLYFDGTNLISSAPIIALNTVVKSYSFSVGGLGVRLDRLMSQVVVTFSGQVTSAITGTPTFNNQLPNGFCPINPASVDYMVVGNINANGYIYFNPDGSIRFMANVPQGAYIRGTRSYITADAYPS